ncbi:hypothetical protein OVA24_05555 [Luteolibacter sp. SL250]|uniref:hypothetical protein n=1 Tax=Luteolibacter sp. SL250 TaxID=2995170 RepID=UPI00227226C8|nr:hypothetical protein [Luteolibacter sp. SL250]WAC20848.1 hypothetical protein OVA24_05555 [Luteolibacter sp. SL250]
MKTRLKWIVVPAFALGLGACKKEAAPSTTDTPAEQKGVVEKAVEKVKDAVAEVIPQKAASPEERAAKLGFVKHLPKNTESLFTVYGAAKTAEKAKALKLWKLIEDEMGTEVLPDGAAEPPLEGAAAPAEGATDAAAVPATEAGVAATPTPAPEEAAAEPAAFDPKALWADEVTIALGGGSGEQLGHLLHLYRRFSYFQMRQTTKALLAQAKSAEADVDADAMAADYMQLVVDLLNDPEGGVGTLEKVAFPSIYLASKVDAANRQKAAEEIASSLGIVGSLSEFAEPVEVEKAGAKFSGYKLKGAKLAEVMQGERASLEETIEAEKLDRLFASIAKKDIVILTGTIGEYVVLFLGGSESQFELAADAKDSLAAADSLKFADEYLSKDLMALAYGAKDSLKTLMDNASGLADTAKGIRDGITGDGGLGDTREIESLIQVVVEREEALRKLSRVDDSGTVAFYEDGLKVESSGGVDQGALDWKAEPKLSHLGDSADVVLFANATMDASYDKASTEFVEAIFETAYAITQKVAQLPGENPDLAPFKGGFKMFDENFRTDALGIWSAVKGDFAEGLGHESAFVVDFKGTVPAIPGIPQAVVDQGKFPRVSVITPVVDRAKVASSWDKINQSATSILAKVNEMSGSEFPMQKPMSSEKNGMTTWFFSMPFFNDDFLPSVTVGDKWFVASTSKNHALDLAAQAEKGGSDKKGLVLKANFVAMQSYAREMQKVLDANADAILAGNAAEYQDNKEDITRAIDALDDFDSLTVRSNRDGDVVRTSVHFKTR